MVEGSIAPGQGSETITSDNGKVTSGGRWRCGPDRRLAGGSRRIFITLSTRSALSGCTSAISGIKVGRGHLGVGEGGAGVVGK